MNFLIIDTETIGVVDTTAFEISWIIFNEEGIIEKRAYLVQEVFDEGLQYKAYYYPENKEKYEDLLEKGEIVYADIVDIKSRLSSDIKDYSIDFFSAFNIDFDLRALNTTFQKYSATKQRLTYERLNKFTKVIDAGIAFAMVESKTPCYKCWCMKNGQMTGKGNVKTTVEAFYRYIRNDKNLIEEHIGIKDCEVEAEILQYAFIMAKDYPNFEADLMLKTTQKKKPYLIFKSNSK